MRRANTVRWLAILAIGALAACSSGDGNEGLVNQFARQGNYTSNSSTTVVTGGQIELRQENSGIGALDLVVEARGVANMWALAFTLEFDPAIIRYDSAELRTFLGDDTQVELVVTEAPGRTDQVVVGVTRLANPPDPNTGVTGTGEVLMLRFDLEGVGGSAVRFVGNVDALDPNDQSIFAAFPPVTDHFIGGSVVTR